MNSIIKYVNDTMSEMKQVTWPTQRQSIFYTILVLAISAITAMYIGAFDYLFSQGVNTIIRSI